MEVFLTSRLKVTGAICFVQTALRMLKFNQFNRGAVVFDHRNPDPSARIIWGYKYFKIISERENFLG